MIYVAEPSNRSELGHMQALLNNAHLGGHGKLRDEFLRNKVLLDGLAK